jgi:hypothetical protein
MTHCGYEPTPSLGIDTQPGDTWKLIKYNFGPRPKQVADAAHVDAYNGGTTGRGHLTGQKTVQEIQRVLVKREIAAAVTAGNGGSGCGTTG